MRLGHAFVGIVEGVGRAVRKMKLGDRVFASAMFIDGECFYLRRDLHLFFEHSGLFGSHLWRPHGDGEVWDGQSNLVRPPLADGTHFPPPDSFRSGSEDARALRLGDTFATGYHGATLAHIRTGDIIVAIDDGAVGIVRGDGGEPVWAPRASFFQPATIAGSPRAAKTARPMPSTQSPPTQSSTSCN